MIHGEGIEHLTYIRTTNLLIFDPLSSVKGVKSNGQWSCDLHVPLFFYFFSHTSD
jgi:hypothetical protein